MVDEPIGPLKIKFNGKLIELSGLCKDSRVIDVKEKLFEMTNVPPQNQKLLGLFAEKGSTMKDELALRHVILKPTTKIMLMGSTIEAINEVNEIAETELIDDFDFKEEDLEVFRRPENLEKLERRCQTYKFFKIAEFRSGKRLLVLDIDYTIFDHLTPAESVRHLIRPYLFDFLSRAYRYYDIAIWSATSMTWILAKISQMNLISQTTVNRVRQRQVDLASQEDNDDPNIVPNICADIETTEKPFKICLLVDSRAMISVHLPEHGYVKEVKPLKVIWSRFPQFGPNNTIMFDDVRRNFAMNPGSGLRIHAYRDSNVNHSTDKELCYLADYLELIALGEPDFEALDHRQWARYVEKNRQKLARKNILTDEAIGTSAPADSANGAETNQGAQAERDNQ